MSQTSDPEADILSISDAPRTGDTPAPGAPREVAGEAEAGYGARDVLRKAVSVGLGAVFMTEEGLRSVLKDLKVQKEVVGSVVNQAEKGKDELMRVVSEEIRAFFESPALKREIAKALSNVTVEMTARIQFNPDGTGPEISFGQPQIRLRDKPPEKE